MGGGCGYDRDVYSSAPPTAAGGGPGGVGAAGAKWSAVAEEMLRKQKTLHHDLDPRNRVIKCEYGTPIILAIDVTGSMGNWSKIVFDKMPMLWGQIVMKDYASDPAMCFAGVGDAFTDAAPLQVTDFHQAAALDEELEKVWLEGKGGGQNYESYELAAAYFNKRFKWTAPKEDRAIEKGFLFFTGDEGFYPKTTASQCQQWFGRGDSVDVDTDSMQIWAELRSKFHVFLLHKPYFDMDINDKLVREWNNALSPQCVLRLQDPKAIVDVMLGAISIVNGRRSLDEYIRDMKDRGQDDARIKQVVSALQLLSENPRPDAPRYVPVGAALFPTLDVDGVVQWFHGLGLSQDYEKVIRSNAIDGKVLVTLTEEDYKELGIAALGDRRKLTLALKGN